MSESADSEGAPAGLAERTEAARRISESRPAPPRFGRENSRDSPDPDWAGIGKIHPDALSQYMPGRVRSETYA